MGNPGIDVLIPTYNRAKVVHGCIARLKNYLIYPGPITYHVGCDGSDDTPQVLSSMSDVVVYRRQKPLGLGGNLNNLIKNTTAPLILQMDDDHYLREPLDLTAHAAILTEMRKIGWIRLYGVGFHKYHASLVGHYWVISWSSPETYINSMRVHLKRRDWHTTFGLYPEGHRLGETEEKFCHQCKDLGVTMHKKDAVHVAIPLIGDTENSWDHVGDSWQLKGF